MTHRHIAVFAKNSYPDWGQQYAHCRKIILLKSSKFDITNKYHFFAIFISVSNTPADTESRQIPPRPFRMSSLFSCLFLLSLLCFLIGSDGTGNGSEEEGSKASAAGSESDSENAGSTDDGIDEEEAKNLTVEDNLTEDEDKTKQQSSSDSSTKDTPAVTPPKSRRKSKKTSDSEPVAVAGTDSTSTSGSGSVNTEESQTEPKKWNFRRNRPLLDFTTMEELNEMDDYDSEDDNDWRPTAGKKKGKAATQKGGVEEEDGGTASDDDDDNEDDDDEDDDDDDDEDDCKEDADDDNNNSSSDSYKEAKKPKKTTKSTSAFDEELTNDSMSQGKGNEVSATPISPVNFSLPSPAFFCRCCCFFCDCMCATEIKSSLLLL